MASQRSPEDRAQDAARGKRPYEAPRIDSESVFETTALACGKIGGQGAKCNMRPKTS